MKDVFRKFKRRYHNTKKAREEVIESANGNIGIILSSNSDNQVSLKSTEIDQSKVARFAALVYSFLKRESPFNYRTLLGELRIQYPDVVTDEKLELIEVRMDAIEVGRIDLSINGRRLTAFEQFELIAKAGYNELDEEALEVYKEYAQNPFVAPMLWTAYKTYSIQAFSIVSDVFSLMLEITAHENYKGEFEPEISPIQKCIICLSETNNFTSEEHVIPESMIGDELYLPRGVVCDECNNGVSSMLDSFFMSFEPIAVAIVQHSPFTKSGKFHKVSLNNQTWERTAPNMVTITVKDRTGERKNVQQLENGDETFTFNWLGRKIDWKKIGRAVCKFALALLAYDRGHEYALHPKFNKVRDFILGRANFANNLVVSTMMRPQRTVSTHHQEDFPGTTYILNFFGMFFFVNIEELPRLEITPETAEFQRSEFPDYIFEVVAMDEPA